MNQAIKTIKRWMSGILTLLVALTLFGLIFIKVGLVVPTKEFFLELGIVLLLTFLMKVWWYDYAEDKRLGEQDIKDEKEKYFKIVDAVVKDTNDLDKFLEILNQENKDNYIKTHIGSRTPEKLAKKTKWMCFWHPSWKELTKEEIGELRFYKLLYKTMRKADKIKQITSENLMALSDSVQLYDAKNHLKAKKRAFQVVSTIMSFVLTTALAMQAFEQIMLNWANVFRYVGYLCSMAWCIVYTIMTAYRTAGNETFDYYSRIKFIIDKYKTYKEANKDYGGNNDNI